MVVVIRVKLVRLQSSLLAAGLPASFRPAVREQFEKGCRLR